jgi:hypothetical protein
MNIISLHTFYDFCEQETVQDTYDKSMYSVTVLTIHDREEVSVCEGRQSKNTDLGWHKREDGLQSAGVRFH